MNVEFVEALNELCKTRRIKKEVLLEAIEQALMSAYKKNFDSASNARVTLDAITGEVAVYAQKKVVEQVENPQLEIAADNPAVDNKYQLGDIVEVEVTPRNFGRIAAQAAKQVKGMLTVEMSLGQMVEDVKLASQFRAPTYFYGRTGGVIPTPEEILEQILKIAGGAR